MSTMRMHRLRRCRCESPAPSAIAFPRNRPAPGAVRRRVPAPYKRCLGRTTCRNNSSRRQCAAVVRRWALSLSVVINFRDAHVTAVRRAGGRTGGLSRERVGGPAGRQAGGLSGGRARQWAGAIMILRLDAGVGAWRSLRVSSVRCFSEASKRSADHQRRWLPLRS